MDVIENEREEFTPGERKAIEWSHALNRVSESALRSLGHQKSRRAQQRAVALLVGHASGTGTIRVWTLRTTLTDLGIYNEANFAQDMKKDSTDGRGEAEGLWTIHTYRHRELRGEWRLTERGIKLAADYAALVEGATEHEVAHRLDARAKVKESVARTFIVRPKAARCPFCREDMVPEDRAECRCGSAVHATCLDEFGGEDCRRCYGRKTESYYDNGEYKDRTCTVCHGTGHNLNHRCVLRRTTANCGGTYTVIAKPAAADETSNDSTEEV